MLCPSDRPYGERLGKMRQIGPNDVQRVLDNASWLDPIIARYRSGKRDPSAADMLERALSDFEGSRKEALLVAILSDIADMDGKIRRPQLPKGK